MADEQWRPSRVAVKRLGCGENKNLPKTAARRETSVGSGGELASELGNGSVWCGRAALARGPDDQQVVPTDELTDYPVDKRGGIGFPMPRCHDNTERNHSIVPPARSGHARRRVAEGPLRPGHRGGHNLER